MRLAMIVVVCSALQTAASAGSIIISGYGTWDNTVSSNSGLSAPGADWSFSILVPDPALGSPNTPVLSGWYALDGVRIDDPITSIELYRKSSGGLFDMVFASGGTVAFYGAGIQTASQSLIPGRYAAKLDDDHASSYSGPRGGEGNGTIIVGASVPEPSSLIPGVIALLALAGLGVVRRVRNAA